MNLFHVIVDPPAAYTTNRPTFGRAVERCERILAESQRCNEPAELEQVIGNSRRVLCLECGVLLASGQRHSGIRVIGG